MRTPTLALLGVALLAGLPACVNLDEDVVTGLTPGRYEFIGEFNADTAKGVVIAE